MCVYFNGRTQARPRQLYGFPTDPSTSLDRQNPSYDVTELHYLKKEPVGLLFECVAIGSKQEYFFFLFVTECLRICKM